MDRQRVSALFALIAALSLVGAPVTMADWGEQAAFSAERVERSQIGEETPILRYGDLSADARNAVRRTIESADGYHTVYGREDWPDRFFYSDYASPGQGTYAIAYEGQYYRLTTYAGGGFPFVYWLYELPFVVYGLGLGWIAYQTDRGDRSTRAVALATAFGIAVHLLGPEFDFPLLDPMQFVGLGALAAVAIGIGLVRGSARDRRSANVE